MSAGHSTHTMRLTLRVWRQEGPRAAGRFEVYKLESVSPDMSFLEMLDVLNEQLTAQGGEPIVFDHDCREGICGSCGVMIDGRAHGPLPGTTTCQLHMRHYTDGDVLTIEPFRAGAFPIVRDLAVDRSAFDRIIARGGYISVNTGSAPDGNAILVPQDEAERSMDAAACIGCGACVAACPNAAAMLFTSAKVVHLGDLPQGGPERATRVLGMVEQMDAEGFGNCSNEYECGAACPKEIPVSAIAKLNREYLRSAFT